MKEYIHYGHKEFNINKFNQVKNQDEILWSKPRCGGLWASAIDAQRGWKQWCEYNEFRDCNENNSFRFTLAENANVVHIYSIKDLQKLPQKLKPLNYRSLINRYFIDFENALNSGIDAIELHLSEENEDDYDSYMESLYYVLYGWDCDSILIMNPDIIIQNITENLYLGVLYYFYPNCT